MKIGIIGCGKVAQVRHIPEYAANPACTLAGFYDIAPGRAAGIAAKYGGKAFDTMEALLADPSIDAVSICTVNAFHASATIAGLKAGKHVLCEKPMAVTMEDCEAMVKAAEESGKRLLIAQNQRFAAAHVKARELVASGAIGKPLTFRTTFAHGGPETWSVDPGKDTWFFDKKRAAMGAMADLGIHKTDAIRFILGQNVKRVTAVLRTLDKRGADGELIGVDDNAICVYEMSGGAIGTMTASWTSYGAEDNATVICGTEGILRLYDDPCHSVILTVPGKEDVFFDVDAIQTNDNQTASGVMDEFVSAVTEDRESVLDASQVLDSMKAVFAAIRSSEEGRPVTL